MSNSRSIFFKIFSLTALAAVTLAFIVPLMAVLSTSLKGSEQIYNSSFSFIPDPVFWTNYIAAINKIDFFKCFFNTLYISFFNVFGVLIASSLAAYAFAVLKWKYREIFFFITIATMMLPDMVLLVPQFLLFKYLGWYGTMLPLIVPYLFGLPFYIFLLRQFFMSIPKDFAESARIDGASELQIWWDIYMSLSKSALFVVALFQFLITWNDLMKPSVYLIDENQYTLSLGLQQFQSRLGGAEWGPLMAASAVMIIPIVLLFIFAQKSFVRGITMSGLKD